MVDYSSLLAHCKELITSTSKERYASMEECVYLQKEVAHYDWVGFYMANHEAQTLHLKAFAGILTDHSVWQGICGQVAVSNENFLVDDVSAQDTYIACDIHVKSEIVIPLFVQGKNIGQIDIDSNKINAFSTEDARF